MSRNFSWSQWPALDTEGGLNTAFASSRLAEVALEGKESEGKHHHMREQLTDFQKRK